MNYSDPSGYAHGYSGDPQYEWAWDFGWWIKDLLKQWEEEDEQKIRSGQVTYESKGPKNGAVIYNSYQITHPGVMADFVEDNRGDDIGGSTSGVVYEWVVHNVAYAVTNLLGIESMKMQAQHVDVGKTIYADQREGVVAILSFGMKASFFFLDPISAVRDMIVQLN